MLSMSGENRIAMTGPLGRRNRTDRIPSISPYKKRVAFQSLPVGIVTSGALFVKKGSKEQDTLVRYDGVENARTSFDKKKAEKPVHFVLLPFRQGVKTDEGEWINYP
jgi:hypothetical protein